MNIKLLRENLEFKNLTQRIITSFVLIFIFTILISFYDTYLNFFIYFIYLFIVFEIILYFKNNIYILFISLIYIFISLICIYIYFNNFYIKDEFVYIITLIVIFDISSYVFGKKFGKLKILPIISPNKTYFGLISGLIITFIIGILLNYYFYIFNTYLMIFFIILLLLSSFIGDVIESLFKRKCNLKNSSEFLPGHGGFFDRFDSIVMVFIFLLLFKLLM